MVGRGTRKQGNGGRVKPNESCLSSSSSSSSSGSKGRGVSKLSSLGVRDIRDFVITHGVNSSSSSSGSGRKEGRGRGKGEGNGERRKEKKQIEEEEGGDTDLEGDVPTPPIDTIYGDVKEEEERESLRDNPAKRRRRGSTPSTSPSRRSPRLTQNNVHIPIVPPSSSSSSSSGSKHKKNLLSSKSPLLHSLLTPTDTFRLEFEMSEGEGEGEEEREEGEEEEEEGRDLTPPYSSTSLPRTTFPSKSRPLPSAPQKPPNPPPITRNGAGRGREGGGRGGTSVSKLLKEFDEEAYFNELYGNQNSEELRFEDDPSSSSSSSSSKAVTSPYFNSSSRKAGGTSGGTRSSSSSSTSSSSPSASLASPRFVKMPYDTSVTMALSGVEVERWGMIKERLGAGTGAGTTPASIESAIKSYNRGYAARWSFRGFHSFFEQIPPLERTHILNVVVPHMKQLALMLPQLCSNRSEIIPLMFQQKAHQIVLQKKLIASLLANAFFCTFPQRNQTTKGSKFEEYPTINFNSLFMGDYGMPSCSSMLLGKLRCIFNYFDRTRDLSSGKVTFIRKFLAPESEPDWADSRQSLCTLKVIPEGTIEEGGLGMTQIDFCNRLIGGGVLGKGCVQEEILFLVKPELIVARLFSQALQDNECMVFKGAEQYSDYEGYSHTFKYAGNHEETPGEIGQTIVAIDATHYHNPNAQYNLASIQRELNKAYCGFNADRSPQPIATGNWGSGAFRGDKELKAMIQIMAASEAGKELVYFTFYDIEFAELLEELYAILLEHCPTVGELWKFLESYCEELVVNRKIGLVDYARESLLK